MKSCCARDLLGLIGESGVFGDIFYENLKGDKSPSAGGTRCIFIFS